MSIIQSARNPLVKQAAALATPRTRRKQARLLVEGPKAIRDALDAGARFDHAFVSRGFDHPVLADITRARVPVHELTPTVFDSIAATEAPQGIIAVAREPTFRASDILEAPGLAPLAVLDGIQDPGNLGTIIRTAAALGFRGAALVEGTTDPYSPKVVRATTGTMFRFPLLRWAAPPPGYFLVVAAESGSPPIDAFARAVDRPVALVVGNEGRGVDPALAERADARVWIPIVSGVESLNVASAFAILAYALTRAPGR